MVIILSQNCSKIIYPTQDNPPHDTRHVILISYAVFSARCAASMMPSHGDDQLTDSHEGNAFGHWLSLRASGQFFAVPF